MADDSFTFPSFHSRDRELSDADVARLLAVFETSGLLIFDRDQSFAAGVNDFRENEPTATAAINHYRSFLVSTGYVSSVPFLHCMA